LRGATELPLLSLGRLAVLEPAFVAAVDGSEKYGSKGAGLVSRR
jgi:hypothetical protein